MLWLAGRLPRDCRRQAHSSAMRCGQLSLSRRARLLRAQAEHIVYYGRRVSWAAAPLDCRGMCLCESHAAGTEQTVHAAVARAPLDSTQA